MKQVSLQVELQVSLQVELQVRLQVELQVSLQVELRMRLQVELQILDPGLQEAVIDCRGPLGALRGPGLLWVSWGGSVLVWSENQSWTLVWENQVQVSN
ncbi:hypothetical protein INR49_007951 [Caranx melampygus]|nr:hypothetical protein INR49_007951 [Caranx melampygus]